MKREYANGGGYRVGTLLWVAGLTMASLGCSVAIRKQGQGQGQESVWVCHGNRNPRWQKVAAAAADAHQRHGDQISTEPREDDASCEN